MTDRDLRDILREARRQGWEILDRGKHYKLRKGNAQVTIAKTPSDWRARQNIIAQLRRAGFEWPPEGKKPSGRKKKRRDQ